MQMKYAISGGVAVGVIALGVALYAGWTFLHKTMFLENPTYTITNIEVTPGRLTSKDELLKLIKIREGDNLFSFKASAVRKNILNNVKNIREIRIRKVLPGTVVIGAEDREPVFRLGDTHFVADRDGIAFILTDAHRDVLGKLPVLQSGERRVEVSAGAPVTDPKMLTVLELVNAYNRMEKKSFAIYGFDATGPNYLIVQIDGYKEALFRWEELASKAAVRQGLALLSDTFSESKAATGISFTVMIEKERVVVK